MRSCRVFLESFVVCLLLFVIGGCSTHPIVEDTARTPTDRIVASVRCEMRLGFFMQIGEVLRDRGFGDFDYRRLLDKETRVEILDSKKFNDLDRSESEEIAKILANYGNSAVAYDFDFEITEGNQLSGALGFQMPFTTPAVFNLAAGGAVEKSRVGKRTFRSQQSFKEIVTSRDWCSDYFGARSDKLPLKSNLLYPVAGSIGMTEVVRTFMKLSEQGGGKDNFVDALTFTTTMGGSTEAALKLNPVPHSFRLIAAEASLSGARTDIHRVKVSLAFPLSETSRARLKKLRERNQQILNPSGRSAVWRARYNICVADARDREDRFKVLRNSPPEIYCMQYANAFVHLSERFFDEDVVPLTETTSPNDVTRHNTGPTSDFNTLNLEEPSRTRPRVRMPVRVRRPGKPTLPSWWFQ